MTQTQNEVGIIDNLFDFFIKAYPRDTEKMPQELAAMWLYELAKYEVDAIKFVMTECIKKRKFFPSLAEFLEVINSLASPDTISGERAWVKMKELLRDSGSFDSNCNDPAMAYVVRLLGGAKELAYMDVSDLDWKRKEFIELYEEKANQKELKDNFDNYRLENSNQKQLTNENNDE